MSKENADAVHRNNPLFSGEGSSAQQNPDCSADQSITVSGVTFRASQVKSAVVTIDGRDIHIGEVAQRDNRIGFGPNNRDA